MADLFFTYTMLADPKDLKAKGETIKQWQSRRQRELSNKIQPGWYQIDMGRRLITTDKNGAIALQIAVEKEFMKTNK